MVSDIDALVKADCDVLASIAFHVPPRPAPVAAA